MSGFSTPPIDTDARLHRAMFNRAKDFRAQYDSKWGRNLKWLLGDQKAAGKLSWQSNATINLIYAQAMAIIPFVGSRKPDIQLAARNTDQSLLAEEVSQLITRAMRDNDIDHRSMEAVFGQLMCGGAWWKITRDNSLNGGMGGIKHVTIPTRSMFMEPGVDSWEDANVFYELKDYSKLSALKRFDDRDKVEAVFRKAWGENKRPQGSDTMAGDAGIGQHLDTTDGLSMATTSEAFYYDVARGISSGIGQVEVVEAHFLDNSTKEIELEQEDRTQEDETQPKKPTRRSVPAYPNGRVVTFCGDYILEDRSEPYPFSPYVFVPNTYIEGQAYSVPDVDWWIESQREFNESLNMLSDGIQHSMGRTVYHGPRANIDSDLVDHAPREYVPVDGKPGEDLLVVDGKSVPAVAAQYPKFLKEQLENASGMSDTLKGEVPGDVRSGFAIEQLQQAGANFMKGKTAMLERALRQAAEKYMHIMSTTYRPNIEFNPNILTSGAGEPLGVIDSKGPRQMEFSDVKPNMFEFTVRAGINLRSSRASDIQLFQYMLEQGIIDKLYFLQNIDIPDKAPLLRRMKPQFDAEQAQRQAAPQQ